MQVSDYLWISKLVTSKLFEVIAPLFICSRIWNNGLPKELLTVLKKKENYLHVLLIMFNSTVHEIEP